MVKNERKGLDRAVNSIWTLFFLHFGLQEVITILQEAFLIPQGYPYAIDSCTSVVLNNISVCLYPPPFVVKVRLWFYTPILTMTCYFCDALLVIDSNGQVMDKSSDECYYIYEELPGSFAS